MILITVKFYCSPSVACHACKNVTRGTAVPLVRPLSLQNAGSLSKTTLWQRCGGSTKLIKAMKREDVVVILHNFCVKRAFVNLLSFTRWLINVTSPWF